LCTDRVEVSLDHLGNLAEQEREAQDQLVQRRAIGRGGAPQPAQLSRDDWAAINQLARLEVRRRRQPKRNRIAEAS